MKKIITDKAEIYSQFRMDNPFSLLSASDDIIHDKIFIEQLLKSFPKYATDIYSFIPPELRQEESILHLVFEHIIKRKKILLLPENVRKDREKMMQALMINVNIYPFINEEFKNDVDFNLTILKKIGLPIVDYLKDFLLNKNIKVEKIKPNYPEILDETIKMLHYLSLEKSLQIKEEKKPVKI